MLVYVAAPYADAAVARNVHELLRLHGLDVTSRWAEAARGLEPCLGEAAMRDRAAANDRDVLRADAMLVLSRDGAGGEMFAEARLAIERGKPIFWVGRPILSAYRLGVVRCATVGEAIALIGRAIATSETGT